MSTALDHIASLELLLADMADGQIQAELDALRELERAASFCGFKNVTSYEAYRELLTERDALRACVAELEALVERQRKTIEELVHN